MNFNKKELDDLTSIMETEYGRRFIYNLLNDCETDTGAFSSEPYYNAFICGKRAIGTDLLRAIRLLDDDYSLEVIMRKEALNENATIKRTSDLFVVDYDLGVKEND